MKKLSCLILILILCLMPTFICKADSGTTNYDHIYVTVNDDGSIVVKEYYSLEGNYNGSYRDLNYTGSTTPYNYDKSSLEGSTIYNGSSINNIKVYDTTSLDGTYYLNNEFESVLNPTVGDYGVYTVTETSNGLELKIFKPSSYNTNFYIEYKVNDVVIIHDDVAEIGWNFFGIDYEEKTKDLKIHFSLPTSNQNLRGFLHGPLNGNIEIVSKNEVLVTYDYLTSNTPIDVRLIFDKEVVPYATKKSNINAFTHILEIEKEKATIANKQRHKQKIIWYSVNILTYLWYIGLIYIMYNTYRYHDKEYKSSFEHEYLRDFPYEYGPEIVEYLFKNKVTTNALSASLLELIRKKHLSVEMINKKKFELIKIKETDEDLTNYEKYLKNWFLNEIGDGNKVTSKDLKIATGSHNKATIFVKSYEEWKTMIEKDASKEDFFEDDLMYKIKVGVYAIAGAILIMFLNAGFVIFNILGIIAIMPALLALIYVIGYFKRTKKGNLHFHKWQALKKFLNDFGRFKEKELPEVHLWEKYLVYATIFGIATKVTKTMQIKLQEMPASYYVGSNYAYLNFNAHLLENNFSTMVNHTITRAVNNSIAHSKSSSGSGFGGGSSYGGGSFGGGGGGGRF